MFARCRANVHTSLSRLFWKPTSLRRRTHVHVRNSQWGILYSDMFHPLQIWMTPMLALQVHPSLKRHLTDCLHTLQNKHHHFQKGNSDVMVSVIFTRLILGCRVTTTEGYYNLPVHICMWGPTLYKNLICCHCWDFLCIWRKYWYVHV